LLLSNGSAVWLAKDVSKMRFFVQSRIDVGFVEKASA